MSKKQIEQIEKSIKDYEAYLNDGQFKPYWKIEKVQSYIDVLTKVLKNGTN